jgi:amino acid adenylation domain-containing protein
LDTELNPVPVGVAGELYVGGNQIARGYQSRANQTAERFIANPFKTGERLYRTGDRVRMLGDNSLEFLGRVDDQIKVRGYRVELREIAQLLRAQSGVAQAEVIARENEEGQAKLHGYVVAESGESLNTEQLRDVLCHALPDYMVPDSIQLLESLPLTANGKLDRKALPTPEQQEIKNYIAPQGEIEETLAYIWGEVLGVDRVGRHDNFFALGGDSILSLKVVARARKRGLTLAPKQLFEQPSLQALACDMKGGELPEFIVPPNKIPAACTFIEPDMLTLIALEPEAIRVVEKAVPGGAANIQDIYPLAPLQEGILFHHVLQTKGDAYVTSRLLSFDSRQRLDSFINHLNQVIARQDILRTAVLWEKLPEPLQVVYRHAQLSLQWVEPAADVDVAEWLTAQVHPQRFRIDVRTAPMLHAVAVRDQANHRWCLMLLVHHLIDDNTTIKQIVEEIALLQQERAAELVAPVPFRNFVAHTRLGVNRQQHETFFRRMLEDVEEPTAPFNLFDIQGDGSQLAEARLPLDSQLTDQVRRSAQKLGVSAASFFHLAWALVLAKTTGKDDVVFGTVLFGRMRSGENLERAAGMFINTLPIRLRLGQWNVETGLRQTHQLLSELLHHEHASLSLAQRCSSVPGGMPLFTSLLNYRYGAQVVENRETLVWQGIEMLGGQERTNYPFGISVDDLGASFNLVAQVHEQIDAQRICFYLQNALQQIIYALGNDQYLRVCELNIFNLQDQEQLLSFGVNSKCYTDHHPVHLLFEEQTRIQPGAIALLFEEEQLSYTELNQRANQLAHYLIGVGVIPETRVGIAVERSIDMVVGLLGILKAGGTYVPLDLEYPQDRLAYMIDDSGIELLLLQRHLRDQLPIPASLLAIELDTPALKSQSEHNPRIPLSGDNLAYVIYTSGSTGKPKGAANRHKSLTSCMQWMQDTYGLTTADTVLHKAAFGFDVSVWELFWPLTSGARLALARPGDHRDPARIIELIRQHRVTTLNFVPVMLQAFLAQKGIEHQTNLRHIICGGEAMPAATQEEALSRLHGASLQNLYGPTEAAIHVTRWTCRADGKSQVPIGRPVSGTRTWVLDGNLNPVLPGVAGELYLGGIHLGRGYLNRPSLTAERFIADPQSSSGERLYRTGDLVRWNGEGQLEYLGRIDHQVKIRGFRIELGEVEAQLLAQPEVRDAVVVAQSGQFGARLVGYVALHSHGVIDAAGLRSRLGAVLPEYMVPGAIVVMEYLPLNANGKVDRKALPVQEFVSEQDYEAPQGEQEENLAKIWAEVLGVERVGRNDNFFELGGNSLAAMRVVAEIRRHYGISIPLRSVFEFSILKELVSAEPVFANASSFATRSQQLAEMELLLAEVE